MRAGRECLDPSSDALEEIGTIVQRAAMTPERG